MKHVLVSLSLLAAFVTLDEASAAQLRCVVTKVSGKISLYSPPELSIIQLDPMALPSSDWSFDDNGGVSAYFKLPSPLLLTSTMIQSDGHHSNYKSERDGDQFEIEVVEPTSAFPAPNPSIKIWIDAKAGGMRSHLLIECLN